jgi:integrase/recombinase XerC
MAEKRKYVRYVNKEKIEKVSEQNKLLVRKYFNFKNMNLSDSSKASYESDFNQWLVYINEKYKEGVVSSEHILDIVEDDIEEMVDLIEDYMAFCTSILGNKERRIQRRMSSISSFFLYLRKKKKIKENPIEFLDRPKVSAGEKPQIVQTFLTEQQIEKIRKELKKSDNIQLQLYFEFSLSTMARVNAVSNVRIDQINFDEGTVNRVIEKEGYEVDLFPSEIAMKLIKKWLEYRKKNGIENEFLFVTKYGGEWKKVTKGAIQNGWIKKIGEIIEVPELHAHDLRHSGSSLLFNKGMALEEVQRLLNHKSPTTTQQHYIKEDSKKLKDSKRKFEI